MKKILLGLLIIPFMVTGQIPGYVHHPIESFDVYIAIDALSNQEQETAEAINLLSSKLKEINKLGLKRDIIDSLHAVKLFMDWNSGWSAMVYHPSKQWLIDNGYEPEKARSVEISNVKNFLEWSRLNQPYMVLHELSHAYHHRVLGFDYPPIMEAYEHALSNSLYDSVSLHVGNGNYEMKESYAKSNKLEYFAELTESYFGQNDFFPFNREDLRQHDPKAYQILKAIWQVDDKNDSMGNCKLPRVLTSDVALGFPKVDGLAPSIGKVNMTVLFVDFEDVPATQSADNIFSIINPVVPDFFNEISYGRMELNLQPHFEWLRVSRSSDYYGTAIYSGQSHLDFIQEAVDLADAQVDFSQTHIVLVMTNPEAKALKQGPTFKSTNSKYHIRADGASIPTGITSGYDLNHWGGLWLAHETGHSLGLPDLYHFGTDDLNRYVGTFGLMGTIEAKSPGYFAFERWILGWLDDAQIYCHEKGEVVMEIESIENVGGIKAIIVPLDSTTALVVECRRKSGFDENISKEGSLIYIVNTSLNGGSGPIKIMPGVDNGDFMKEAPRVKGDKFAYQNVTVEVLESKRDSDKIKVTVN